MYRGDWLARKIVDIVPYDMVREWREWAGDRPAVAAAEAAERRLGLRKAIQRALTLGRLYGGAAIIVGTNETRPQALAAELDPDTIRPGDIRFLHVVSRWQLGSPVVNRDPLDPWFGEPPYYEVVAPERGALQLHPSRVLRFLGNEWPDPSLGVSVWSDSILQTLYDAIHAVALTTTGATSLMHEAKVDVVTVPNLSEHLSSAATTAQLSARFSYAAAMKSINNLLLLGDGETWNRQRIDFGGLPQMVQTFLQVAAGAADIPVTRLIGQSPAGLSATGDSDTRNYYDMISSRQEIDLRPQLERLDRLILRSAGVDPAALTFEFRPLWQLDAAEKATVALSKAQATAAYAGLNLWPAEVTAKLVQAQLVEDGIYPNAETIFAEARAAPGGPAPSAHGAMAQGAMPRPTLDFSPDQPRDPNGRWSGGGGLSGDPSLRQSRATGVAGYGTPLNSPAKSMIAGTSERRIQFAGGYFREEEKKLEKENEELMGGPPPTIGTPEEHPLQIDPLESQIPPSAGFPQGTGSASGAGMGANQAPSAPPPVLKPAGIPDHWIERPSRKKGGMKWSDPNNGNNAVRSMPGDPDSPFPHQQIPYIKDQNGDFRDVDGNPIGGPDPGKSPEAHIPASSFKFKRP